MTTKKDMISLSYRVFNSQIWHLYSGRNVVPGLYINSPFLSTGKKSLSFCVFKGIDGQFMYMDYVSGECGDSLRFTEKFRKLSTSEAYHRILQLV